MLKQISLYAIKQIFEKEATIKISANSKMCYISCLMHHFDGLPANLDALAGFDLQKRDIKNFARLFNNFLEMSEAGLIKINEHSITFFNHWAKHVDKTRLERANPHEYLGTLNWQKAAEFKENLLKNENLYDLLGIQKGASAQIVKEKIDLFIKEQTAVEKMYPNLTECTKHFINWFNKTVPAATKNSLKSTSKLLG